MTQSDHKTERIIMDHAVAAAHLPPPPHHQQPTVSFLTPLGNPQQPVVVVGSVVPSPQVWSTGGSVLHHHQQQPTMVVAQSSNECSLTTRPPPSVHVPLSVLVWQRLSVLVTLLLFQSFSQVVLESYEGLISTNIVIPLFLTMLVGAGGNAGNQSAVHAITGIVTGEKRMQHLWPVLKREAAIGILCATILSLIGFLRVYYFYSNEENQPSGLYVTVLSISLSLFIIVLSSVVLGCALPYGLRAIGLSVEHAAPIIQVLMDILGVLITCTVCSMFMNSASSATTAPPTGSMGSSTTPSGREEAAKGIFSGGSGGGSDVAVQRPPPLRSGGIYRAQN